MTPNPGSWYQGASHNANADRAVIAGLLIQEGVGKSDALLCGPGGLMVTNVSAGHCFIPAALGSDGFYHGYNDATYPVTHDAADASPRVDRVVAKVDDNFVDAGGFNRWRIFIVKGSTASYPSPPALPSAAISLALVTVPNGVTTLLSSHYADDRLRASGRSGVVVCTSGTRPTAYEGLMVYEKDTDKIARYDGAAWRYLLDKANITSPANKETLVFDGTEWKNEPLGLFRYDELTADTGGITDTATIINALKVPAFPFVNGRRYLLRAEIQLATTSGSGYAWMQIRRDGTLLKEALSADTASLVSPNNSISVVYEPTSTATRDIEFWLKSASSGYNVKGIADANHPAMISVQDVGRVA